MFYFVLTIHVFLCLMIIGLVLLQQGKGAQVGAILSGSSNTLFGAAGASTAFAKLTTGAAVAFFITSMLLVRLYASNPPGVAATNAAGGTFAGSVLDEATRRNNAESETAAPVAAVPAAPVAPAPVAAPAPVPAAKK